MTSSIQMRPARFFRSALFATAMTATAASPVLAEPPTLQQMIKLHNDLDEQCRGGAGNDPATDKACDSREHVSRLIKQMGYCMAYPQYTWHRC